MFGVTTVIIVLIFFREFVYTYYTNNLIDVTAAAALFPNTWDYYHKRAYMSWQQQVGLI